MKPRVLFALIVLACWVTIMMVIPTANDEGQQQVLAIGIDRSDGNIEGNILAAVPCVDADRNQGINDGNSCFVFNFLDDGWADSSTKTAPGMGEEVLANANCDVPGAVCIISGGDPDGGRSQIMANTGASIIGPDGGKILTS